MKILIMANSLDGLFGFRRELLEQLISDGYEVIVSAPEGMRQEDIKRLGCQVIVTPMERRGTNPLKDLALCNHYRKLIKKERPDVVLTYTIKPNVYGGLACRLTRTPYLANVTGLGTAVENGGLLAVLTKSLYRMGLKKANCVFFQNQANRQLFIDQHIVGGKTQLLPGSGVNLEQHCFEPYPAEDTPVRLTFVGRIMRDKGIGELLEAAENVKKMHPEVQFDLIGSFDENYQEMVQENVDSGTVNYLGSKSDMHPYYRDSWAVLMPSYHEGTSNVCLEAASTGRPVLASLVPGCQETFDDGVSGIGFAAKSAVALQETIEKFLALSYEQKAAMGAAGRKKMEREYDRQQVIDAYLEEINIIVSKK